MTGPATAAFTLLACLALTPWVATGVSSRRSVGGDVDPDSPGPGRAAPRRRLLLSPALNDDETTLEMGKRRFLQFDDYGHMRFGKRGDPEDKFDDYGHMRFGRGGRIQ